MEKLRFFRCLIRGGQTPNGGDRSHLNFNRPNSHNDLSAIVNSEKTEPIYIRELEIDDLAPVYHLGEELFTSDLYPYLYRTWDEWEVIGLYNTDPEYCLVAESDDRIAGFILGTIISKGAWTYGYIIWLGVSPHFQRQGIANKLVDKFVERTIEDGARFMLVDTDPVNVPAVNFFTRKGFGNSREHIFLSMNLSKHDYYGKLIANKRKKQAKRKERRARSSPRSPQPEELRGQISLGDG
ncbi:MAG TPA: GNAT family N-acetyltransferase [Oscillatoriales cyanobacterium M59_W2019_021]|nr:GNAT family N-acetyltransferase [Oscillatoriales cyanobacterium M4454_W2019_049]HIK50767.1 GNAT family N-acetyltransferase [Oscillatoriales cyanobacterium M59_W2019_021]